MTDRDEQLLQRLDLLIALTRMSVRDALARELHAVEQDPVSSALLRHCEDWRSAGELKDLVCAETGQSEPTVKRRIADLVARGALLRRGAARNTAYRNSGLLEI